MTSRHRSALLLSFLFALACVGSVTGCGTGGEEIPLAKVPPPPPGFDKVQAKSSIPSSASPTNANERRK